MDADPTTGMLVGETQTFPDGPAYGEYRIGGTSLASPLMAGVQALAQQRAGGAAGLRQPGASTRPAENRPGAFLDVAGRGRTRATSAPTTSTASTPSGGILYSVRTFNQDSSLAAGPGWDDVTGFGSPSPKYINAFGG